MHSKAYKLFYGLAIFILLNAMFVLNNANDAKSYANNTNRSHDSHNSFVVSHFKQEIRQEFSKAFIQTIGDQPFLLPEVALIFDSVDNFYRQSAQIAMNLLEPRREEEDAALVMSKIYLSFAGSFNRLDRDNRGQVAGEVTNNDNNNDNNNNFMTEEPIYNIVPYENR